MNMIENQSDQSSNDDRGKQNSPNLHGNNVQLDYRTQRGNLVQKRQSDISLPSVRSISGIGHSNVNLSQYPMVKGNLSTAQR